MLKTLFLLFSIINLSNSFFNFTIDLYRDKPFFPWEVIKEELTFKSTTELDVVAFFYNSSHPPSPISIQKKNSNEYLINYTILIFYQR